jgi:hypothetical protein
VTFEPGARTAWHTHLLGQTLIVTSGCGRVQRWGGPIEEICPGDVVGSRWAKSIGTAPHPSRLWPTSPSSKCSTARAPTGWKKSPRNNTKPDQARNETIHFLTQIGGIPETQEMLDYCVANNIYPQVEVISVRQLDEAYQKVLKGEVKFRYVLDMSTLK